MSLIMRKIGLGAFLSLICLDFFDMTDPIVQGEGRKCIVFRLITGTGDV